MMQRSAKVIYFTAILILLAAIIYLIWYERPKTELTISSKINFKYGQTTPSLVTIGSNDLVYTLEVYYDGCSLQTYKSNGIKDWTKSIGKITTYKWVLVSVPNDTLNIIGGHGSGSILWISILKDRQVLKRKLPVDSNLFIRKALLVKKNIYLIGEHETEATNIPIIIKLRNDGRKEWTRTYGPECTIYDQIVEDKCGDIVVAGTIGSAMGTCIMKYSPDGHRIWSHNINIKQRDSGHTIHLGIKHDNTIICLVSSYNMDARSYEYLLLTYSSTGKLIKIQTLYHGSKLNVVDAGKNERDELYVLGNRINNRRCDGNAELTKYDSRGRMIWSGVIRLPDRCEANQMELDDKGNIYIVGRWHNYYENIPDPSVRAFIYKVIDRR